MLTHRNETRATPSRVVVLGSRGFLGAELISALGGDGIPVVGISSADIDLSATGAAKALAATLTESDSLVIFSALTPDKGRGIETFMANLRMIENVAAALAAAPVAHVVYISSDAVYPMMSGRVTEASCAAPEDLYGTMHKVREVMLQTSAIADRLAVLRATLIYGHKDTHNSYGPNRLRRQAAENGEIKLFGAGEETRDHVLVSDAGALIREVLVHASTGTLNLASGRSIPFNDLAHLIADCFDREVPIIHQERNNPITHRHFDITVLHHAFPKFVFTPLEDGIKAVHAEMVAAG